MESEHMVGICKYEKSRMFYGLWIEEDLKILIWKASYQHEFKVICLLLFGGKSWSLTLKHLWEPVLMSVNPVALVSMPMSVFWAAIWGHVGILGPCCSVWVSGFSRDMVYIYLCGPWCHQTTHRCPGHRMQPGTMVVFDGCVATGVQLNWVASIVTLGHGVIWGRANLKSHN